LGKADEASFVRTRLGLSVQDMVRHAGPDKVRPLEVRSVDLSIDKDWLDRRGGSRHDGVSLAGV